MVEVPLEKNELQLTTLHRLSFDKMNIALLNRYEKKVSRGKNSEGSGEYGYDKQRASYFGNLTTLGKRLIEKEFLENLSVQDLSKVEDIKEAIDKALIHIDKVCKEVTEHLKTHITIDLGEPTSGRGRKKTVKGSEIAEDEVNEGDAD